MKSLFASQLLLGMLHQGYTQEIIKLPYEKTASPSWEGGEKEYFSQIWQNKLVTKVSIPTMQVFRPEAGKANDTSEIVAPGGGLCTLRMIL